MLVKRLKMGFDEFKKLIVNYLFFIVCAGTHLGL